MSRTPICDVCSRMLSRYPSGWHIVHKSDSFLRATKQRDRWAGCMSCGTGTPAQDGRGGRCETRRWKYTPGNSFCS